MSDTQMVENIKRGELRSAEELFNTAFNYLNNKYNPFYICNVQK